MSYFSFGTDQDVPKLPIDEPKVKYNVKFKVTSFKAAKYHSRRLLFKHYHDVYFERMREHIERQEIIFVRKSQGCVVLAMVVV